MAIEFQCPSCQNRFSVKDEMAGKRAKCKCGSILNIPQPTADRLDDLEDDLSLAAEAPQSASQEACPSCGTSMVAGTVFCVKCGYDCRTGERRSQASESSGVGAKESKRKARGMASLLRGTLFSLIGAFLGAVVWAVVAVMLEVELGWIAWGIGALAGGGMALGHEDDDGTWAGIIAGGSALLGIVGAKVLIVVFIIAPLIMAVAKFDEPEFKREGLAWRIAHERLEADGKSPEQMNDDEWAQVEEKAVETAKQEVKGMTDEQVTSRLHEFDVKDQEAAEKEGAGDAPADGQELADQRPLIGPDAMPPAEDDPPGDGRGLLGIIFASMFSPIDGIFILIALATAYKLGSGKATG